MDHQRLTLREHLLDPVRFVASPNCDDRPADSAIELLVIHNISLPAGSFGGPHIHELFCNVLDCSANTDFAELADLRVSAHLFINRAGEITQFVPFDRRAWHAGQSTYEGRAACNDFSIGIELEGADDCPFEAKQYDTLVAVSKLLCEEYSCLNPSRIVGHSDIAPGRKTDPGPCFDWGRYLDSLERSLKN